MFEKDAEEYAENKDVCYLLDNISKDLMNYDYGTHDTLNQKYWEGFTPIELESNLVLRPYLYNKVRVLGVLDYLHFRELRYKTNKWQRKFI